MQVLLGEQAFHCLIDHITNTQQSHGQLNHPSWVSCFDGARAHIHFSSNINGASLGLAGKQALTEFVRMDLMRDESHDQESTINHAAAPFGCLPRAFAAMVSGCRHELNMERPLARQQSYVTFMSLTLAQLKVLRSRTSQTGG